MENTTNINGVLRDSAVDVIVQKGAQIDAPGQRSDFIFPFSSDSVEEFVRQGDDLLIVLDDGQTILIVGFYVIAGDHALIFQESGGAIAVPWGLIAGSGILAASAMIALTSEDDNVPTPANVTIEGRFINGTERAAGVTFTGTAQPGSAVDVNYGTTTLAATVDANGNWSADFPASAIEAGEYETIVTAVATDANGIVSTATSTIEVDTLVTNLSLSSAPVEGDNVVNQAEASDGINLSGQVEPGSTVLIDFEGTTLAANVDASGNWSIAIPADAIPDGSYDAAITVMATDAAGNTATIADTLKIDTEVPEGPVISSYTRDGDGIRGIFAEISADDLSVAKVNPDGSIIDIVATQIDSLAFGETNFQFETGVSNGTHMIVSATDSSGNSSGTYVIVDDESINTNVDLSTPGLSDYQIVSIDLAFAREAQLTITEAELVGLADGTNTLQVKGSSDDAVTITGANQTGSVTGADGQNYDVYSLGEATVLIDDDITVYSGVIG